MKFTERLLIFFTVNSFFTCLLFMIRDIGISNGVETINLFTVGAVFVSAVLIYSILLIFFNEKSSTANFIRLLVFYTLIFGAIVFFLRRYVVFSAIITVFCSIGQTILYKKILEAFFSHDVFEQHCQSKNNSQLQKELYDYNIYLSDAAQGYRQNRTILVILGIILCIGTTIFISADYRLSIFSILLIFAYFICAFCNFFLYSHYVREATFASNGFVNVFDFRYKIFFTSILICIICFGLGFVLSSNYALIKFTWIFNLFNRKKTNMIADSLNYIEVDDFQKRMMEIQSFQEAVSDDDNGKFGFITAIIFGVLFVAIILWFFFKPFFTKIFAKALKNADLKNVFKTFFRTLKEMFKKLFHLKIKPVKFSGKNAERFKNDMTEFLKNSRKSKEKKAELDRLTSRFMKLIDWGEQNGIHYTKNLAPAEFTSMLENKNAELAGLLFEKALYAKECLTKTEETDFGNAVNAAISKGIV